MEGIITRKKLMSKTYLLDKGLYIVYSKIKYKLKDAIN